MKKIIYLFLVTTLFSCGEEKRDTKELAEEHAKKYCECLESELNDPENYDKDCTLNIIASFYKDIEKEEYSDEELDDVKKKFDNLKEECTKETDKQKDKVNTESEINEIVDDAVSEYCECSQDAKDEESESQCLRSINNQLKLKFSLIQNYSMSSSNKMKAEQALSDEKQKELIAQVMSELDTACDN